MSTEISDKSYKALNRDTIKYIAMFTMLLNHIATIFLTPGTWLFEFFLFYCLSCSCRMSATQTRSRRSLSGPWMPTFS